MDDRDRRNNIFILIITFCSGLTFLVILIAVIAIVPRAVNLMKTAQRTLDNMESVSEDLKALELAEAIKAIENDTAQTMSDVSSAMEQVNKLDIESLNQSIQELKESTEKFSHLFDK